MNNMQRVKYISTQIIQFIIFYYGTRIFLAEEAWRNDKLKEMSFFLIIGVIYTTIGVCFYSFAAPIKAKVFQKNKQYKGEDTNFSVKGRTKTPEHERTIEFKIEIVRQYSIWGYWVLKLLKNIDFFIEVEPLSDNINIQVIDGNNIRSITQTPKGFAFNVGEYIQELLQNTDSCSVSKSIYYKIVESSTIYSVDEQIVVKAQLSHRGFITNIVKIFTKVELEEHHVKFIRS